MRKLFGFENDYGKFLVIREINFEILFLIKQLTILFIFTELIPDEMAKYEWMVVPH